MNVMAPVLLSVLLMLLLLLVMRRRSVVVLVLALAVAVVIAAAVADRALLLLALATRLLVDFLDGPQLLLQFHAPVLEPNLDLALRQAQGVGDFDPPPPRQVVVKVELFLQFQRLVARVRLATSSPRTAIGSCAHNKKRKKKKKKKKNTLARRENTTEGSFAMHINSWKSCHIQSKL